MRIHTKQLRTNKSLLLLFVLTLLSIVLMGCGAPDIDEEMAADEAHDRFAEVLEQSGWTNMNYDRDHFGAVLDENELTLMIQTDGFYNFFVGQEQNYSYYRDMGIYTLKENGQYLFDEHDNLEVLRVILWSTDLDSFGESEGVNNLVLSLSRENFANINWDGLEQQMIFGDLDTSIFEDAYIRES